MMHNLRESNFDKMRWDIRNVKLIILLHVDTVDASGATLKMKYCSLRETVLLGKTEEDW